MATTPNKAVSRLGELLLIRMVRNSRLPLADVCDPASGFSEPDAELVEHLLRHRQELASWIDLALGATPAGTRRSAWERNPDGFLRERLVGWLWQKNQFLHVDEAAYLELDALYRRSLRRTAWLLSSSAPETEVVDGLRGVLARHQEGIASFLRARLGEPPREAICAEYSPSLQLEVLGVPAHAALEPVLDVGCGVNAALVRYLRDEGLLAYGIDRAAPEDDVALRADWLSFGFGTGRWGTVVSHLAFSLHFLRHHLGGGPTSNALALAHAEAYMRILSSLRVGGSFAYAPALPFIEGLLPASDYRVEHVSLPRGLATLASIAARGKAGPELGHAARVWRLA